jgi:hypothetical protein
LLPLFRAFCAFQQARLELRFNFIAFSACRPNAQNRLGWRLIDSRSFTGKILLLKQKAPSKIMDVCEAGMDEFVGGYAWI